MVKELPWQAPEIGPDSFRVRRGKASWLTRADTEPQLMAFPLMCSDELYSISVKPKEKMKDPEPEYAKPMHAAETWDDALNAKFVSHAQQPQHSRKRMAARLRHLSVPSQSRGQRRNPPDAR